MLKLKEPVTAKYSENYLAVLEDANGVTHFWLHGGKYDGNCVDVKSEQDVSESKGK